LEKDCKPEAKVPKKIYFSERDFKIITYKTHIPVCSPTHKASFHHKTKPDKLDI
jgi:hypothetical protein